MISWLDAILLPMLIGLPLLGGFFVALMPASERVALRHVGLGMSVVTGLLALRVAGLVVEGENLQWLVGMGEKGVLFSIEGTALPALLAIAFFVPMCIRAGAPRVLERTKGYVCLMLALQSCAMGVLVIDHALIALTLLDVMTVPLLILIGMHGGPLRGTVAQRTGLLWLSADAAGLTAIVWLANHASSQGLGSRARDLCAATTQLAPSAQVWVVLALCAPALVRLAVLPVGGWTRAFFEQAPVSVVSVYVVTVFPLSVFFLHRWGVILVAAGVLSLLGVALWGVVAGAVLAGFEALVSKDLRVFSGAVVAFMGAACSLGVLSLDVDATSAALWLSAAVGVSLAYLLFVIDAIERRFLTRDSTELLSLAVALPGLWRLLVFGLLIVVGVPLAGGGAALAQLAAALVGATAPARATWAGSSALLVGILGAGWVLLTAGATMHLRRVTTSIASLSSAKPSPLLAAQALRLWVPVAVVVAASVVQPFFAPSLRQASLMGLKQAARTLERSPLDTTGWIPDATTVQAVQAEQAEQTQDSEVAPEGGQAP